jgi:GTP-binding protein YchF
VGVVAIPDARLDILAKIFRSKKTVPTTVNFVDVAGLVRGASQGLGLGNQFLSHLRAVDAVAMVVRCFESADVTHAEGGVDPQRDIDIINLELALADLSIVDKRLEKSRPRAQTDPKLAAEVELLERMRSALEEGRSIRSIAHDGAAKLLAQELSLLTAKPMLLVANVDENPTAATTDRLAQVRERARVEGAECIAVSARLEAELAALPPAEAKVMAAELGIERSALDEFIIAAQRALDLMTFLTANENEAHAWTAPRGSKAVEAAGKVHSDMARGFVRAEVVPFDVLARMGSLHAAKEAGLVRVEGRDYIVQEGDVLQFRFNV